MASVLIVDDSSEDTKGLIMMLQNKGYSIDNVPSGKLALEYTVKNIPDVILLGINISDMSSYEACKLLRSDKELIKVPVIFVLKDAAAKSKIFDFENADYITMPFDYREVFARIDVQIRLRIMQYDKKNLDKKLENLLFENDNLKIDVLEGTKQLQEITDELREFNVILEDEITERTKTEEALKESERQLRYSLEEAPIPLMLYTEDGKIKNINRTWSDITGYTIADMPTTADWAEISDIFIQDQEYVSLTRLVDSEKRHNDGEYTVKTRNGNLHIWDFYSAYIGKRRDGHKLFMRVAIDVTERKRIEELQKSVENERKRLNEIEEYDKIKTEFLSNISHELRTPINVIFAALQMHELNSKKCPYKNKSQFCYKYDNVMKQNCYRLLRLINNLIDITKIDTGFFNINKVNYNIIELVEDITLSVADYTENKGLSLIFDTDVEEKIIACDPEKIERIILNLLSNAVKFTPRGGSILVDIKDGMDKIRISVKDTGKGIPKEKIDSIFERFVQVDKSFTREHEGSGIGLSLVKALVEFHGGSISVKSQEDQGTEFIIYLPCKLEDAHYDDENLKCEKIGENRIEKINIEFSDIYS